MPNIFNFFSRRFREWRRKSSLSPFQQSAVPQKSNDSQPSESYYDKYKTGDCIGSGSFSQVHECISLQKHDPNHKRAVKITENRKDPSYWGPLQVFEREVSILKALKHPNIVRMFESFDEGSFFYQVMEQLTGGELFQFIVEKRRVLEEDSVSITKQLISALSYMHENNVIFRDLKAENVIFENKHRIVVKLVDFGMAVKAKPNEKLREICGSPAYLAPELIGQAYNRPIDCWALGILVYLMLFGKYPYNSRTPQDLFMNIMEMELVYPKGVTPAAITFMKGLLQPYPKKRMTMKQAIKSHWLNGDMRRASLIQLRKLSTAPELIELEDVEIPEHPPSSQSGKLKIESAQAERLRALYKEFAATFKDPNSPMSP
jgi:myosin-light-chain kinase